MKKNRLLLLLLFILVYSASYSQAMWMLILGDKISFDKLHSGITVSLAGTDMYGMENATLTPNWALGGFMDFLVFKNNNWVLSADFTFKTPLGARNTTDFFDGLGVDSLEFNKQSAVLNSTAFTLPLYVKYNKNLIGFGAGFQMSLIYKSTLKYTGTTGQGTTIKVTHSVIKKLKKFDIGPFVMFEFYLKPSNHAQSMRLGARYFYGLLSPIKSMQGVHNGVVMGTLSIPIGSKESVKEQ